MRQLRPTSNLILAVLASVGLIGSLSLNWFATPVTDPDPYDGPVETIGFQLGHVFASHAKGMVDGNTALGGGRSVIFAAIAAVILLGFAVTIPSIRRQAEDLLRVVAFAVPLATIGVAFAHPGTSDPVRLHVGLIVGILAALLVTSAAWHAAEMREQKKAAPARPRYSR